jgi:hypothetical protein
MTHRVKIAFKKGIEFEIKRMFHIHKRSWGYVRT